MVSTAFDDSGNLIPPTAEELAEADRDTAILCYIDGVLEDGRPYYAYVAVTPSKYLDFKAITAARETMVIGDYGTVIEGGFQTAPPPSVIRKMKEDYGFDDQYVEKLVQRIRDQHKAFMETKENKRLMDIVALLKNQPPVGGESA